jgi:hypothetical protein
MKNKKFKGFDPQAFTVFMQDFLPTMGFYKNSQGEIIACAESIVGSDFGERKYISNPQFLSKDGVHFFQLVQEGYGGNNTHHQISINNLFAAENHNPGEVFLEMESWYLYKDAGIYFQMIKPRKYQLSFEHAKVFQQETTTTLEHYAAFLPVLNFDSSKIVFHPLPKIRRTEYLLRDATGALFFVDCLLYNWDYSDFRVFHGSIENIQEIPIQFNEHNAVVRYRDGGTTFIKTEMGTLFIPTRMGDSGFNGKMEATITYSDGKEQPLEHVERGTYDVIYDNDLPKIIS